MRYLTLSLAACAAALPIAASAQEGQSASLADYADRRLFFRGAAIYASSVTIDIGDESVEFEGDGESASYEFGYSRAIRQSPSWRMGVAGGFITGDEDNAYSLLAGVTYLSPFTKKLSGYVGGGLGIVAAEAGSSDDLEAFTGYEIRAGVDYAVMKGLNAQTGYRLLGYIDDGLHARTHSVQIGVEKSF